MSLHMVCAVLVLVAALAVLYRVIVGPTALDRVMSVNVIGTKTIILLVLIGFIYRRPAMFLDIALVYALINFIATIAILRYLEGLARRRLESHEPADGGAS